MPKYIQARLRQIKARQAYAYPLASLIFFPLRRVYYHKPRSACGVP